MNRFLWLDLETTGLYPETGVILEYAAVLCDDSAGGNFEVEREHTSPIHHSDQLLSAVAIDDYVHRMHDANGLWNDVRRCDVSTDKADELLASIASSVRDGSALVTLAGSSVHFDLAWCRVHLPRLSAHLSHRVFDVRSLRTAVEEWAPQVEWPSRETHRALPDILTTIDEARIARRAMFGGRGA